MTGLGLPEVTKIKSQQENQSLLIAKFVPAKHKNCKLLQTFHATQYVRKITRLKAILPP